MNLSERLIAAANGDDSWRGALLLEAAAALTARGMSAGTAKTPKTPKAVEGEARQPGPKDAPIPSPDNPPSTIQGEKQ